MLNLFILGTMGCVHVACLEQWLNFSHNNACELCSYRFEVVQVRRYSLFSSIFVWICKEDVFYSKTCFFIFLSTINSALLCWLWLLWMTSIPDTFFNDNKHDKEENDELLIDDAVNDDSSKPKWIIVFVFLTFLSIFSLKTVTCDAYKALRTMYNSWYQWWNETVEVKLLLDLRNYKVGTKLEDTTEITLKTLSYERVQQREIRKNPLEEIVVSVSQDSAKLEDTTEMNLKTLTLERVQQHESQTNLLEEVVISISKDNNTSTLEHQYNDASKSQEEQILKI